MSSRWVHACSLDALVRQRIVAVAIEGQQFIVVRDESRFFAAERACPHEGADLAKGRCSGARLVCPRHYAWFDLRTGEVSPGWSFRALRVYPVRAVGTELWIDLDAG
jgi:3-phenylpropionate/trans-cinnamate dioxygenase ferredoxin subunit